MQLGKMEVFLFKLVQHGLNRVGPRGVKVHLGIIWRAPSSPTVENTDNKDIVLQP